MSRIIGKLSKIIRTPDGVNLVAEPGSVEFALCNYGSHNPRTNIGTSFGAVQQTITVNPGDGAFALFLFGNDIIDPPNTYYTYTVKNENGDTLQCTAYFFLNGEDYDLDFAPPFDPSLPLPPVPGLIFNQLQVESPPAFDAETALSFQTTLTQDETIVVNNAQPGNLYTFIIIQDAAGGHQVTWPANFYNATTANLDPNGITIQTFVVLDTNTWYPIAPATWFTPPPEVHRA